MDFSPLGLASDGQTCDRANWRLVRGKKLTVAWHKLPPCEYCEMGTAGSPYFFFETLLGNKYYIGMKRSSLETMTPYESHLFLVWPRSFMPGEMIFDPKPCGPPSGVRLDGEIESSFKVLVNSKRGWKQRSDDPFRQSVSSFRGRSEPKGMY
jgi:hypothetical protein